jgi:uncharacterized tellurite resistance protein B-like protein
MPMTDASRAIASWLGALSRAAVLRDSWQEAGDAVASYVVGEPRVEELRAWLSSQTPEVATRERRAAIEVCIWMVHADRDVDPEETDLLREIIASSQLDEDTQDLLVREAHELPSLRSLEKRLTHPVLRELLLALCWELASVDGRVAKTERDLYTGLAKRLGVSDVRAAEIQRAMGERAL